MEIIDLNKIKDKTIGERLLSSEVFKDDILAYADKLRTYYVLYHAAEPTENIITISDVEKLNNTLISQFNEVEKGVNDEYYKKLYGENGTPSATLYNEKEEEIQELRKEYILSDSEIRSRILSAKTEEFWKLRDELRIPGEFEYCIENQGTIYTNIPNSQNLNLRAYMQNPAKVAATFNISEAPIYGKEVNLTQTFAYNGYTGYIIVPVPTPSTLDEHIYSSEISAIIAELSSADYINEIKLILWVTGVCVLLLVGLFCYMVYTRSVTANGFSDFEKIYGFQPFILKIFLGYWAILELRYSHKFIFETFGMRLSNLGIIFFSGVVCMYLFFAFVFLWRLFRDPQIFMEEKDILWLKNRFTNFEIKIKSILTCDKLLAGLIIFLTFLIAAVFVAALFVFRGDLLGYAGFAAGAIFVWFIIRVLTFYGLVDYIIENIQNEDNLSEEFLHLLAVERGIFVKPINNLAKLREILIETLNENLKTERLKTELITSVSHDLRTPLTSIINYVELLKGEKSPDEQKKYLRILDEKSNRLSALIDDLFEASKLQSGDLTLDCARIDVVNLLKQSLGEIGNVFEESRLTVKTNYAIPSAYVFADGKRVWRVFENLLINISKYAMPASRVYISVNIDDEDLVNIEFKNVAAHELNISEEALFERFVRGESSKQGSGLGLSISKKIVELHGGKISIVIDGDLFKVSVRLKKFHKETSKNPHTVL